MLRKETFFKMHRFFLLSAVIISLVLPFLNFSFLSGEKTFTPAQVLNNGYRFVETALVLEPVRITGEKQVELNILHFIWGIYLAGVFLLSGRLIYHVLKLVKTTLHSEKQTIRGITINVNNRISTPFSFLGKIYFPSGVLKQQDFEEIVIHEAEHINQRHGLDLLFIELLSVFQWFNPVVWIIGRKIRDMHEYLADHAVISKGYQLPKYQKLLLLFSLPRSYIGLIHTFNYSLTKKRTIMMQKRRSPKIRKWRVLFLLPVVLLLNMAFSNTFSEGRSYKSQAVLQDNHLVKGKVLDKNSGKVLSGASVVILNTHKGTVTDKNGEFTLKAGNEKISLAVSYVGYKTTIVEISNDKYQEINLKRDVYKVSLKQGEPKENTKPVKPEKSAETDEDETTVIVEEVPHFPGGIQALKEYLSSNIQYPEKAEEEEISGTVLVRFTVDENGAVKNVTLDRALYPPLDKEALRVISSMPDWKPGYQHGKAVTVELLIPVEFVLDIGKHPAQYILKR